MSETGRTPQARSWSQYRQYVGECPKQFELARLRRVPRRPGPWLPAGTAVHEAIETYFEWRRSQIAKGIG